MSSSTSESASKIECPVRSSVVTTWLESHALQRDWQTKVCRTCGTTGTLQLHFAARAFRTLDQIWLPSDVESVCIQCKAKRRRVMSATDIAVSLVQLVRRQMPELLITDAEAQHMEHRLTRQDRRCAGCTEHVQNLFISSDAERFLSIPQRVRYGVRLSKMDTVGVHLSYVTEAKTTERRNIDVAYFHVRCRPTVHDVMKVIEGHHTFFIMPHSQQILSERLDLLTEEVQELFQQVCRLRGEHQQMANNSSLIEYVERTREMHRKIIRYHLMHEAGCQISVLWNKWLKENRAERQSAIADEHAAESQYLQRVSKRNYLQLPLSEEDNDEEVEEGMDDDVVVNDICTHDFASVPTTTSCTTDIPLDIKDPLWKRLTHGARQRSRRRGAIHRETLMPVDVHTAFLAQEGKCVFCHKLMLCNDISVNRINTSRMNAPYGPSNFNLAHISCNIADAPNNLEQWLQGMCSEFRSILENSVPEIAMTAALPGWTSRQVMECQDDLQLQLDEVEQRWQKKHIALQRLRPRVQKLWQWSPNWERVQVAMTAFQFPEQAQEFQLACNVYDDATAACILKVNMSASSKAADSSTTASSSSKRRRIRLHVFDV